MQLPQSIRSCTDLKWISRNQMEEINHLASVNYLKTNCPNGLTQICLSLQPAPVSFFSDGHLHLQMIQTGKYFCCHVQPQRIACLDKLFRLDSPRSNDNWKSGSASTPQVTEVGMQRVSRIHHVPYSNSKPKPSSTHPLKVNEQR